MYVCIYIYMCVCTYMCTCMCLCTCICICMCLCMCMCMYMYCFFVSKLSRHFFYYKNRFDNFEQKSKRQFVLMKIVVFLTRICFWWKFAFSRQNIFFFWWANICWQQFLFDVLERFFLHLRPFFEGAGPPDAHHRNLQDEICLNQVSNPNFEMFYTFHEVYILVKHEIKICPGRKPIMW